MIVTRAPVRLSIGGGGTDLPSYYRRYGSEVVFLGIDLYIRVASYPDEDPADDFGGIVADGCRALGVAPHRIDIFSDVPESCGLGTSGALLVALVAATQNVADPAYCAETACRIEIEDIGRCVGKQDQYAAAYGGLAYMRIDPCGAVRIERQPHELADRLSEHLLIAYDGVKRNASRILEDQARRTTASDPQILTGLHRCKASAAIVLRAIEQGQWDVIGHEFNLQWQRKCLTSSLATSRDLDAMVAAMLQAGAYGAKVCGAGGGGFIVAVCEDVEAVQLRLSSSGMPMRRVRPSEGGVHHVVRW